MDGVKLAMRKNHCQGNCKASVTGIRAAGVAVALVTSLAASASAGSFMDTLASDGTTKTFFYQFVVAGGPIVWVVLLPMSVITGYLAIDLCYSIRRKRLLPTGIAGVIATTAGKVGRNQLGAKLASATDLVSRAICGVIVRSKHLNADQNEVRNLAVEALQQEGMHLLRKVEWCNIIGNVAPMVGLFGTVFGMIKAFNLLGISAGQPRPDQLAAAISIALITTFWGLLVAIPALAMGGVFRARTEALVAEAAIELEALLRRISLAGGGQIQPAPKPPTQKKPLQRPVIQKIPSPKQPLQKQIAQSQFGQAQNAQAKPASRPDGKEKYQASPVRQNTRKDKRQFPIKPVS
jgi:biopolymer transport protein ExbB